MRVTGFMRAVCDVIRRDGVYYIWQDNLMREFKDAIDVQIFCDETYLRWACAYPRYPELHIFLR